MKIRKNLKSLHETSMRILSEIGMRFHHPKALSVFQDSGFKVEANVVKFDPDQLMTLVSKAPDQFTLFANNSDHDALIGGENMEFAPCYGSPFIIEPDGKCRNGLMGDYIKMLQLIQQSEVFNINGGILVQPNDVPSDLVLPVITLASVVNSDKCLFSATGNEKSTQLHFSLLELLHGGKNAFKKKTRTFTIINTLSPLQIDRSSLETLFEYIERNQAVVVSPTVMAGTTGPVTLAGTLSLANAEALAVIALTQLLCPGTPVVYGCQATTADMRTGGISIGRPERSLCIQTGAALARTYGLPYRSGGCDTDAQTLDTQCGSESMMAMMVTCQSHTNLVIHSAGILGSYGAASLEKLVYDIETIQRIRHWQNGIETAESHLAFDAIKHVGIGGEYLTSPHTLEYCRKTLWTPTLTSLSPVGTGSNKNDLTNRIQQEIDNNLVSFRPPDMASKLKKELIALLEKSGIQLNPKWFSIVAD